jgi:integrating conjugative element protein (TIGR03757 family)
MPASSHALLGLTLFGSFLISGTPQAGTPLSIEVFATTEFPISGKDDRRLQGASVTEYYVDGLEHFESTLSESLPNDAETARAEALRRIGQLDGAHMAPAKSAAIGLAKAVQFGVDRYPAVVFYGRAVVYGLADLVEAIDRYEAWQRERAR